MRQVDVVVVGAGAAGLMAALAAGGRGASVLLLDSQAKIGAKILVAGGGRCNVTNDYVDPSRFHSGSRALVGRVLRSFTRDATIEMFKALGVPLKLEETGKYFPVSNSSRSVLNALVEAVRGVGVELISSCPVLGIEVDGVCGEWRIRAQNEVFCPSAVVLCTGGLALPKSGSNGAGYKFAQALGHSLIATSPALTPLLAKPLPHAALAGVTLPVRLSLTRGRESLASYCGSFLFTHVGYSGPAALNLSRHVVRERWTQTDTKVALSFLPDVELAREGTFWQELVRCHSRQSAANTLAQLVPRRAAEAIGDAAGVDPQLALGRLSPAQQLRLRQGLFATDLPVCAVADYVKAEATAGGINLDEFDPATLMSRLHPGLFMAGEILDVDGWLGGYNFQWAWSSGTVAGRAAARYAGRRSHGGSITSAPLSL